MDEFRKVVEARAEKTRIIAEAKRILDEIDQHFTDVSHWNVSVRKPNEPMIDPDPGRTLRHMRSSLAKTLGLDD